MRADGIYVLQRTTTNLPSTSVSPEVDDWYEPEMPQMVEDAPFVSFYSAFSHLLILQKVLCASQSDALWHLPDGAAFSSGPLLSPCKDFW